MSGICLGTTVKFQGRYKILSLCTRRMVTRKNKIREITIPNWVIQSVEVLAARDGKDLADGSELLFVDRFENGNYFAAALREGSITLVAKYDDDDDENTDASIGINAETPKPNPETNPNDTETIVYPNTEDPGNTPRISLEGALRDSPQQPA